MDSISTSSRNPEGTLTCIHLKLLNLNPKLNPQNLKPRNAGVAPQRGARAPRRVPARARLLNPTLGVHSRAERGNPVAVLRAVYQRVPGCEPF